MLTGITSTMVAAAPRIGAVLPTFLEFARGAVLVAHNAPFDIGFLKAACAENGLAWPAAASVDTAVLARRLLSRDEVPNCKLATLAPYFRASTSPTHRALDDARATVDVLHGLFERLGPLGITSLEELTGLTRQVDPERLRKRHLADAVPRGPGVYLFRGPRDEPLYVGTSNDLRSRVRSYFSSSEQRSRITEMVALSQRVEAIPCAHDLEAAVRELRLIAEHKPRYNRRSRFPERALWVRLTEEPFPRLSVVRRVRPGAGVFLGPFPDRRAADAAVAAVHESLPLRQCTTRISPRIHGTACALAGMGRCGAPCTGAQSVDEYAAVASVFRAAVGQDPRALVTPLLRRVDRLAAAGTLRGRRAAPGPRRRARAGRAPPPAAGVPGRRARARPRPARRRRRLAPVRRAPRPAGRRRRRGRGQLRARDAGRAAGDRGDPRRSRRRGGGLGRRDGAGAALDGEAGHPARGADRHPRQPGAGHRGVQPLPRPGRRRAHRPGSLRRRPVPGHPGPAGAGERGRGRPGPAAASIPDVITAIVMIDAATDSIDEVAAAVADLDGVSEVYSTAGEVDLIAIVRVREFEQVAQVIAGRINKVPGVLDTETHIAFRAYSRHDLEAAFAIGFETAD